MREQLEKDLISLAENIIASKGQLNLQELKLQANQLNEKITILNFVEKYYQHLQASNNHTKVVMSKTSRFMDEQYFPNQPIIEEKPIIDFSAKQEEKTQEQSEVTSPIEKKVSHPWEEIGAIVEEVEAPTTENPISLETETPAEVYFTPPTSQTPFGSHNEGNVVEPNRETPFNFPKFDTPYPAEEKQTSMHTENEIAKEAEQAFNRIEHSFEKVNPTPSYFEKTFSQTENNFSHSAFSNREEEEKLSINDALGRTNQIGLNERLAFIKNLFIGSESEYNRVMEKLNTFQSPSEAIIYLEQEVKPIYNYWRGKAEHEELFMRYVVSRYQA